MLVGLWQGKTELLYSPNVFLGAIFRFFYRLFNWGFKVDVKLFVTVVITVFLAELGDKTQFATMAFAAGKDVNPWLVFAGASLGLIFAAGIGVVAGQLLATWLNPKWMTMAAGFAFVAIGALTLHKAFSL